MARLSCFDTTLCGSEWPCPGRPDLVFTRTGHDQKSHSRTPNSRIFVPLLFDIILMDVSSNVNIILHTHRLADVLATAVDEAKNLILAGHLDHANTLLSHAFRLHNRSWGTTRPFLPLKFENIWVETGTRPSNAPPMSLAEACLCPEDVQARQRELFEDSIGIHRLGEFDDGEGDLPVFDAEWDYLKRIWSDCTSLDERHGRVTPRLDRLLDNQFYEKGPKVASFWHQHNRLNAAQLSMYIFLRVGLLDRAQAQFNKYLAPAIAEYSPDGRHMPSFPDLLSMPGVYSIIPDLVKSSEQEAYERVTALTSALHSRELHGAARPYVLLDMKVLIDKLVEALRTRHTEDEEDEEWFTPLHGPAASQDIAAMEERIAGRQLPFDYLNFLRYSDGIYGPLIDFPLCSAGGVCFEDVETNITLETWDVYEQIGIEPIGQVIDDVICIYADESYGCVWLVEPYHIVQARKLAIDQRRKKETDIDEGSSTIVIPAITLPNPPSPRYNPHGSTGYCMMLDRSSRNNLPPEIIDIVVTYALRNMSGDGFDRKTALALCSTSRRMHEVCP